MDLTSALDAVDTAVDALAQIDPGDEDSSDLRALLPRLKVSQSKLEAQVGRFTHASDAAGVFIGTGARDTAEWLGHETGTSTRKNRASAELGEAMAKSDELAAAVESGRLSTDKASAAVGAAGDLPVDDELLDGIVGVPLAMVRPATESWRARRDAEHDTDVAAAQRARRYLRLTGQADGMTRIEGALDPESAAIVRTSLDSIMNHTAFDGSTRTRDQGCADALTQLAKAASKGTITGGRSNAKLLATVPIETIVERGEARGLTHAGPTLDAETVRRLACDAGIHRVITGPGSSVLDFGRETRLVSENLFLALVARDQHCRWPGCSIRATWCDAHHIVEWLDGGHTNEATCALLCHFHHSMAHQPGWSITGNGHEFVIHRPDGSTETSTPPARSVTTSPTTGDPRCTPRSGPPPDGAPLRADSIGGPGLAPPACDQGQLALI